MESKVNFKELMKDTKLDELLFGLNDAARLIHANNVEKGFWDEPKNVGELLMLVTSELGEAMEAHRKNKFADVVKFNEFTEEGQEEFEPNFKRYIKDTFEDEIADAIIRLLDLSAGLGIDIASHILHKVKYNTTRPRLHGKLY